MRSLAFKDKGWTAAKKRRNELDGFIALSFPHFRLLIPLSSDFSNGGTSDSSLNFYHTTNALLDSLFLLSLLVLPSVQDSPSDLTRIAMKPKEWLFGFAVQEVQKLQNKQCSLFTNPKHYKPDAYLSICPNNPLSTARMDLISAEVTEFGPVPEQKHVTIQSVTEKSFDTISVISIYSLHNGGFLMMIQDRKQAQRNSGWSKVRRCKLNN